MPSNPIDEVIDLSSRAKEASYRYEMKGKDLTVSPWKPLWDAYSIVAEATNNAIMQQKPNKRDINANLANLRTTVNALEKLEAKT